MNAVEIARLAVPIVQDFLAAYMTEIQREICPYDNVPLDLHRRCNLCQTLLGKHHSESYGDSGLCYACYRAECRRRGLL